MARESILILRQRIDIPALLSDLNAALSEEWLAFYQYWIGAQIVEGTMRSDVQREFDKHALEEFAHAKLLADRIIQLEGLPVLDPAQWVALARCKYEVPLNADVISIIKQNIASERCAVIRYEEIASKTNNVDYTTCDIAKRIMAEEEEHEQELQDFLRDIEWTLKECEVKYNK
ncbi:MAG: ferritin [Bacteroidaceae bacterium]|nr:ferritin [Bacteroidaceae bacterium]